MTERGIDFTGKSRRVVSVGVLGRRRSSDVLTEQFLAGIDAGLCRAPAILGVQSVRQKDNVVLVDIVAVLRGRCDRRVNEYTT